MATLVAPSLERLIKDARVLLNQPMPENSRFTDAELTGYANDALQQIFLTVNEAGEGQFDKQSSLSIVANQDTVPLPVDCFSVKAVFKMQNTIARRLEYHQNILNDYDSVPSSTGTSSYEPYYYFRGNNLVLRPIPGTSETGDGKTKGLVIEYTAYPQVLVYGGDNLDSGMSPLFKELIVMYVVAKAKLKDDLSGNGQGYALAASHRNDLFKQFRHQLMERSKAPQFVSTFEPF